MFTGIIREIGHVISVTKTGDWTVEVRAPVTVSELSIGSSVACNGVCLTTIELTDETYTVQLSTETLAKTVPDSWQEGRDINVEPSLRMGDELGGHIVSGHVDGLAKVVSRTEEQDSIRFVFKIPDEFEGFLAPKGSIALDGISLTINDVNGTFFGVNIIPHTQKATTIGLKQAGDMLNFEIDTIARYVGRMLAARGL